MKILWLIPKWTLPATDGARVATDSLIRNTILSGAKVDVLCLPMPDEATNAQTMVDAWNVDNVFIYLRADSRQLLKRAAYYLKNLLLNPLMPVTFSSFAQKGVRDFVQLKLKENSYDYILLDGLHLGVPILDVDLGATKVIYRAHNLEVDLWKKSVLEKKNPVMKCFLAFQAAMVDRLEKRIISQSHAIAAIAREDLDEIRKFSQVKAQVVPLGLKFRTLSQELPLSGMTFLFIGRLDWAPNKDGLEWILKEVWPEVIRRRPGAILKIVGSGNGSWLQPYQDMSGIKFVGFVKDLKDAYDDAHFTIVPIHYGSGTRIKVIESFAMGKRLISTHMGVQGAGLDQDDYVAAESAQDWIDTLSTIEFDHSQVQTLQKSVKKMASRYDELQVGQKFYEWLKTL